MDYAPLLMVGGFLMFGLAFVIVSDTGDAISRWLERRKR